MKELEAKLATDKTQKLLVKKFKFTPEVNEVITIFNLISIH